MKYKHNLSARNFELFCISYIYYSTYLRVCKCFYSYLRIIFTTEVAYGNHRKNH